jgi:hypothetical protein
MRSPLFPSQRGTGAPYPRSCEGGSKTLWPSSVGAQAEGPAKGPVRRRSFESTFSKTMGVSTISAVSDIDINGADARHLETDIRSVQVAGDIEAHVETPHRAVKHPPHAAAGCRPNAPNSTQPKTSGSSYATTGYPTGYSNPTTTLSPIVAMHGTNSSISLGASWPSAYAIGCIGHEQ